ncbi:hypothetical protein [Sphingobium sp. DC-2]|jgi:hypothetical protein|uniref:hypothetical protein n=1 Tax=Sphingobium sp. DC-2 TaxID=1303256 RepID=UPI001ED9A72F|nr:hypothetical protein [Sphingobium sp. DC-2]
MTRRSSRAEVRNPVLGLPAARLIQAMPADTRALLSVLLLDLAAEACHRSRSSWERRKVFVAAYWATVAVYAGHIARVLGGTRQRSASRKPFRIEQKGYAELAAANWAEASNLYCERRDRSGLGASMYPEALLLIADTPVGRISYNGRIWLPGDWEPGTEPLYDNRSPAGH